MLTDAALAIAVGTDIKWIYNASRRLGRTVDRSWDGAVWWRLTHHLAGQLGLRLVDAAQAADGLLASGAALSRVRLRATRDESIAIAIDIDRFLDGAAIAAAAASYLAVPRKRGRPRRHEGVVEGSVSAYPAVSDVSNGSLRLANALAVAGATATGSSPVLALRLASALTDAGVPFVLVGAVAAAFHGTTYLAASLDIVSDCTGRPARAIADVLNSGGAVPRGVPVRGGFRFDAALVRSADCLALQVAALPVNIGHWLPGVGGFPEVREASDLVTMESLAYRVLSRDRLRYSMASRVARGTAGAPAPQAGLPQGRSA